MTKLIGEKTLQEIANMPLSAAKELMYKNGHTWYGTERPEGKKYIATLSYVEKEKIEIFAQNLREATEKAGIEMDGYHGFNNLTLESINEAEE